MPSSPSSRRHPTSSEKVVKELKERLDFEYDEKAELIDIICDLYRVSSLAAQKVKAHGSRLLNIFTAEDGPRFLDPQLCSTNEFLYIEEKVRLRAVRLEDLSAQITSLTRHAIGEPEPLDEEMEVDSADDVDNVTNSSSGAEEKDEDDDDDEIGGVYDGGQDHASSASADVERITLGNETFGGSLDEAVDLHGHDHGLKDSVSEDRENIPGAVFGDQRDDSFVEIGHEGSEEKAGS
ncbi:MAG: hypothetical protein Q9218_002251 [Villophora microphyllina]